MNPIHVSCRGSPGSANLGAPGNRSRPTENPLLPLPCAPNPALVEVLCAKAIKRGDNASAVLSKSLRVR